MTYKYIVFFILLVVGVLNLVIRIIHRRAYSVHVEADVIEVIEKMDHQNQFAYYPVYLFQLNDKIIELQSTQGFNPSLYKKGDKAILMFKPGEEGSEDYICDKDKSFSWLSIVCLIGAFLVYINWILGISI